MHQRGVVLLSGASLTVYVENPQEMENGSLWFVILKAHAEVRPFVEMQLLNQPSRRSLQHFRDTCSEVAGREHELKCNNRPPLVLNNECACAAA